jgi:hypothetical protein
MKYNEYQQTKSSKILFRVFFIVALLVTSVGGAIIIDQYMQINELEATIEQLNQHCILPEDE